MPDTPIDKNQEQQLSVELAQASTAPVRVGHAETITGLVEVIHLDGSRENLTTGEAVFFGDAIETSVDGNAAIIFDDDSIMSLGPEANITVDELIYDPGGSSGSMAISITEGVFTFISGAIAKSDPNAMVINTPTSVIGIRGTQVVGDIRPEGEENTISLMAEPNGFVGEITLTNAGGTQVLNQEGATIFLSSFFDPPPPPVIVPREEILEQFQPAFEALPPQFRPPTPPPPEPGRGEGESEADAAVASDEAAGDEAAEESQAFDDEAATEEEVVEEDLVDDEAEDADAEDAVDGEEIAAATEEAADATEAEDESAFKEAMDESGTFDGDAEAVAAAEEAFNEALADGATIDEAMQEAIDAGEEVVVSAEVAVEEISLEGGIELTSMTSTLGPTGSLFGSDSTDAGFGGADNPDAELVPASQQFGATPGGEAPPLTSTLPPLDTVQPRPAEEPSSTTVVATETTTTAAASGVLTGTSGADVLTGGAENNTITGGGGNDTLNGGAGNDTYIFASGFGDDVITDDSGTDTLQFDSSLIGDHGPGATNADFSAAKGLSAYQSGNDLIIDFGSGESVQIVDQYNLKPVENIGDGVDSAVISSSLTGGTGNDFIAGTTSAETLTGNAGDDLLFGHDDIDTITGDAGDDMLYGGAGNDILQGGADNDALFGGTGNDTLDGDAGDDLLDGGTGNDALTGGSGNDTFHFTSNAVAQSDTITVAGTVEAGDTYTVTVDSNNVVYTTTGLETDVSGIRDGILAAINADATVGAIVTARVGDPGILIIEADFPGTSYTLATSATDNGSAADNTLSDSVVTSNVAATDASADTITDFAPGSDRFEINGASFGLTTTTVDFETITTTYDGTNSNNDGGSATANVIVDSNDDVYVDNNGSTAGGYTLVANLTNSASITASDVDIV